MVSKEDLLERARKEKEEYYEDSSWAVPIFEIMVFEHPEKLGIYDIPDLGAFRNVGFVYSLDDAIEILNTNKCDLHEYFYRAAFILMKLPGLYVGSMSRNRMYFLWDQERKGFFQAEEPEIFSHFMY